MIVVKVGGSVLKKPEDFLYTARRIREKWVELNEIPIIVVSAMKGVTDELISASLGSMELLESVEQRYMEVADELGSRKLADRVRNEINRVREALKKPCNGILRSYVVSLGERLSRIAMTQALEAEGVRAFEVDATDVIVTNSVPDDAIIEYNITARKLLELIDLSTRLKAAPVIEGFVGADLNGLVTTLGRGSSDYTATTIASILGTTAYLVTEVPGIMTADPAVVPSARPVEILSYEEAHEAACLGVKGMNPKAIEPLMMFNSSSVIIGTWDFWGTKITSRKVKGPKILCHKGSAISIVGHGVNSHEFALKLLRSLEKLSIKVASMEFNELKPLLKLSAKLEEETKEILARLYDKLFSEVS
ncbi:amino acid kinase family protein [Candidatus Methanodesulfokora washburnensis]|jgi:aspartate kinase|uniref:Aspartate kinase n=1 Tax=Candidatus Methanodesulfokora washburnensis TaxID=2478471 RepID=A0A429GGX8_9CREN|nr:aspartate kinase [Candidatus Methanodesulfokores washburnensis]RSN73017.1 aspartate kinase [Candidatus Methanodesulfokores washburnensis]